MLWRELQAVAREAEQNGNEVTTALREAGVTCDDMGVVSYLTPSQLREVEVILEDMENTLSFEATASFLSLQLQRAYRTNMRW